MGQTSRGWEEAQAPRKLEQLRGFRAPCTFGGADGSWYTPSTDAVAELPSQCFPRHAGPFLQTRCLSHVPHPENWSVISFVLLKLLTYFPLLFTSLATWPLRAPPPTPNTPACQAPTVASRRQQGAEGRRG